MDKEIIPLAIKSGVFEIRPHSKMYLKVGGRAPISVTPNKTYKAFLSSREEYPLIIVLEKEGKMRYFPVALNYARNNFSYQTEVAISNQSEWVHKFKNVNEHIRKQEKISLINI